MTLISIYQYVLYIDVDKKKKRDIDRNDSYFLVGYFRDTLCMYVRENIKKKEDKNYPFRI